MFDWLQQLAYFSEIQWLLLVLGVIGFLLNTVLFHSAIALCETLLDLEFVRDARQRSPLFAKSCEIYERNYRNVWLRVLGVVVSCFLIGAACGLGPKLLTNFPGSSTLPFAGWETGDQHKLISDARGSSRFDSISGRESIRRRFFGSQLVRNFCALSESMHH